MVSLLVALPLSLIFWVFSVVALSGSIAVFIMSVARILMALTNLQRLVGSLIAGGIMIWLSLIVGWGAYGKGSHIIDSLIARF